MPQRFIRKNPYRKSVRPAGRTVSYYAKNTVSDKKQEENKEIKTEKTDMNNVEQLKAIVGNDAVIPKRKVKIEKKDKGLIERTEDSTILITEDNKMMLND